MEAFPPDIQSPDGDQPSGLICPDCGGNITVRATDGGLLVFECRVGHVYTVEEMLIGKEAHVEYAMWAAVHAYAELAALLRTLGERGGPASLPESERVRRTEQAEAQATILRQVLETDRRLTLVEPVDGHTATP